MKVRDVFFSNIYDQVAMDKDVFIVSSDIGAPSLDKLRKNYPQRFVNVGIAEQNAIVVAAGLSLTGKKVITYGLNPFPVTRAFDQIRNVMSSLQIPITVTALNAGTCASDAGYTHMAIETMSIMRTLKNVSIINPSDETIAEKLVEDIMKSEKPRYVQFDKFIEGHAYTFDEIDFDKGFVLSGKWKDRRVAVITYGIMAANLRTMELPVTIFDFFSLPINIEAFLAEIKAYDKIITVEDGVIEGGIGSLVLEILNEANIYIPVIRKGLRFSKGYSNVYTNRDMLMEQEHLTKDELKKVILQVCEVKS